MKRILIIAALCATLGACVTASELDAKISQVQTYTKLACSFIPTVATVAKIFATGGTVDSATSVANAICNAVTTAPLADGPGDRIPRVNGVVIKGNFVR